jgi:thioredoxin 1
VKNSFFILENKATRELLAAEAKAWAKANNRKTAAEPAELLKPYFDSLTAGVSVSDADLKDFYEKNTEMMGGATFDQVKDDLKQYVLGQKRQNALDAHIASIGKRTPIDVNKAWVEKQYTSAMDNPVDKARLSGKPSLVDFGADGCGPCDMMTPVLESLTTEYEGRMNILFVHVRKEQILAARYGIQSIPVQVFFDKGGKEVFRHVGFFPKEQIVSKLSELGVK